MRRVLGLVDDSPIAPAVAATASTLARIDALELDLLSFGESSDALERTVPALDESSPPWRVRSAAGPIEQGLTTELATETPAAIVLGACSTVGKRDGLGHVARMIATTTTCPLVLVPPHAAPLVGGDLRFLLPLDGERPTTESVMRTVEDLFVPIGTVVPLHVFADAAIPMLMSSDEDRAVIADEFAARHTASIADESTSTRLGLGDPGDAIIAAREREHFDAVILCWKQQLQAGRADVVRRLLTDGRTVVVLVPVT